MLPNPPNLNHKPKKNPYKKKQKRYDLKLAENLTNKSTKRTEKEKTREIKRKDRSEWILLTSRNTTEGRDSRSRQRKTEYKKKIPRKREERKCRAILYLRKKREKYIAETVWATERVRRWESGEKEWFSLTKQNRERKMSD